MAAGEPIISGHSAERSYRYVRTLPGARGRDGGRAVSSRLVVLLSRFTVLAGWFDINSISPIGQGVMPNAFYYAFTCERQNNASWMKSLDGNVMRDL